MALKVSLNHPDFPKGKEFHITGLGTFKNGGTRTLTQEEEEAYYGATGMTVKEGFKDSPVYSVEGTTELKRKEGGDS